MTSVHQLEWPDRYGRIEKARWRQTLRLLEEDVSRVKTCLGNRHLFAALASPADDGLGTVLAARVRLAVQVLTHVDSEKAFVRRETHHIVAVTHPELLPVPLRMALFRRCARALRPNGRLLVIANVVGRFHLAPDGSPIAAPTCSDLIAQLQTASGQGLMAEDVRSVRWGTEPVRRGASLSMVRLSTPAGW